MEAIVESNELEFLTVQAPLESDTDFYNRVNQLANMYNRRVPGVFKVVFRERSNELPRNALRNCHN